MEISNGENLFVRLLANPDGLAINGRPSAKPDAGLCRVDNRPVVYRAKILSELTRGEIAEIILKKMPDRVLADWIGLPMTTISRIRRQALRYPDECNTRFNLHIPQLVERNNIQLREMLSDGLSMVPEEVGWGWRCDERG